MSGPSSLSAVVPTLGRSPLLVPCLEALRRDGGADLEIVVVDQGERPVDLPAGLADRVVRTGRNLGFAAGTNRGIAAAAGRLIATVNDDVLVEPGWIAALVGALEADPRAAAAQGVNLILDAPDRADGCGLAWNRWWQAVQVGHGLPAPQASESTREVFGASATAALFRRDALDAVAPHPLTPSPIPSLPPGEGATTRIDENGFHSVEVFDSRLISYYEDVELACRLRAAGWRALLVPAARARHAGSATGRTMSRERWRLIYGNRWLVAARLLGRGLWPRAPWLAVRDLVDLVWAALDGDGAQAAGILGGWARAFGGLPAWAHAGAPARTPHPRPLSHLPPSLSPGEGRTSTEKADDDNVPAGSTTPLLSGIVVHWHNEELLAELTDAWPRDPRFELVVVDNGSATPLRLGPARLVQPGKNLGFAGGANAGIAATRAPIVLLLNPDAVPEAGALDALLAGFAAWPDTAGLAPRLTGPAGESQAAWQLRRLPSAWGCLLHTLPWAGAPGSMSEGAEPPIGAPVEQPAAAALALRRDALERIGGLDAGFYPAWFEDVDLARRLRADGAVLRYWPAARFRHHLGSTVPRLGYGPFLWIYYRNLTRYLEKHHGRGWAAAARIALVLGVAVRLLFLPFRRPRRATSRGEAARGLMAVLAGTLTGWRGPHPPDPPLPSPPLPTGRGGETQNGLLGGGAPLPGEGGAMGEGTGVRSPRVAVCIVTHDSAPDLPGCLEAVARLDHRPLEVVVVDCASTDGSLEIARRCAAAVVQGIPFQSRRLAENAGFAGGMNAALRLTDAPFVLTFNADARPAPDYVTRLLALLDRHPELRAGAVTGRLVRLAEEDGTRRLDACGMRLTRTWRHLDRGSGEADRGQWSVPEQVFGATGAASLFRRAALDDAAVEGEIFDSQFHSFREDAELCFRLRERGWEVLYEPTAVAEHRRFNLPEQRAAMPPVVNFHSLKNRYLLRLYHQTARNLLRTLVPALARDLAALGYVLLRERSSLAAYAWLWRHRAEILRRRRIIQERRTVTAAALDRWFFTPGEPL